MNAARKRSGRAAKHDGQQKGILDDKTFARKVNGLVGKTKANQLEIGSLIHAYIEEHGNSYGDKVHQHIDEITDLSLRSVRKYHPVAASKRALSSEVNIALNENPSPIVFTEMLVFPVTSHSSAVSIW